MKQRIFEEQSEARWAEFDEQVGWVDSTRGPRLDPEQRTALVGFPDRYLAICRDLAIATERQYSPMLIDRLNRLTLDGHRVLYAKDPNFALRFVRFVAVEFPRRVREEWVAMTVATLLFLVPGIAVWALILNFPELIYSVLGGPEVRNFESMYDPAAPHIGSNRESADDVQMFGFYIFNNIGIAFRAFAGGLAFGVGSSIVLVLNGILLGAVAAHISHLGFGETFFSFVIGHGAFELTAIVISGAAGLLLGWSILSPGALSRVASLRRAAKGAMDLVYGVFGMLVIAAVLEAFWSSKASLGSDLKFGVGAGLWAFVFAYLLLAGRVRRRGHEGDRP